METSHFLIGKFVLSLQIIKRRRNTFYSSFEKNKSAWTTLEEAWKARSISAVGTMVSVRPEASYLSHVQPPEYPHAQD